MLLRGRLLIDPAVPPEPGWLRVEPASAGGMGRIVEMGLGPCPGRADLGGQDRIITPAFIDAHVHIPQFGAIGCDGLPLLAWLERVIYPAESWWSSAPAHAARAAAARLLREGTLGVGAWLSSHAGASREALSILAHAGLRAVAGRVAMDRGAPDALIAEDRWRASQRPAPSPVLPDPGSPRISLSANPRFALACSEELLAEIGWARRDRPDLYIQTHLAETQEECAQARALHPAASSYTDIYDRAGLLGPRTLLAHCLHLSSEEWALIADRRAVVVHCPGANLFLGAGLFDLASAAEHGVRLALGSDVAAGPDIPMPRVARAMIDVAKARAAALGRTAPIPTPADAWRLITRGNSDALGWADGGRVEVGAAADLLVLRPPESWMDEHLLGRLLYGWSAGIIEARIVNGAHVDPSTI